MKHLFFLGLFGSAHVAFAQQSQAELQTKIQELSKKGVPGASKNIALYQEAQATYEAYLTQFPTASDINEARFGYAEILFRQGELGDNTKWTPATAQYQEILAQDAKGARGTQSALGLLISTEKWSALLPQQKTLGPEGESIMQSYQGLYQKLQTELPKNADTAELGGQCAYRLGELYAKYGQDNEALAWLEKGLRDFPTASSEEATATQLLVLLLEQNKNEALVAYIARFRKDDELSKEPDFQASLDQVELRLSTQSCLAHFEKQEWPAAAECFEAAYKVAPKEQQATLLVNAATSYQKAQQPQNALTLYQELVKKYPTSKEAQNALLQRGYLSLRLLDLEDSVVALEAYAKKLPADSKTEDALFTAALIRESSLQYEEAINDLNLIIRIIAKSASRTSEVNYLYVRIAKLRDQQGDTAKAQSAWEQIIKRAGTSPSEAATAHASLGHLAWQKGKKPEVEKHCTKAVSLFKTVLDNKEEQLFETEPLARCAFYLGELQVQKTELIKAPKTLDHKKITIWLDDTRAQIDTARQALNQVKDFGATTWALGALFRAGQMSFTYAKNLEELSQLAPDKSGTQPEVLDALKTQTSSWSEASRKDAEAAWSTCTEGAALVRDPGIWMEQCEAMLNLLNANLYPQTSEWITPATNEPPPITMPSLVTSLKK
jgi:tetratricopeptide (TPR) repeat protein